MTLHEFLQRVIDDGIAAAKESYAEGTLKRDGAVAGFDACRSVRRPAELASLLLDAEAKKRDAYHADRERYWYWICYHAEIEFVCNVVSAVLQNAGLLPIITPTMRGFQKAASIVGIAGSVQA